ncbi:SDR family NAD(P)-dependent oxidoreductase [Streptomyces sp. NPDC057136]|uniref:SDR family NAD(P)-dependent oxidoreductase n=1 Tax=Streptomyces sp. NPDC057136 TaxID=3346029 RepID=UPI00362F12AA
MTKYGGRKGVVIGDTRGTGVAIAKRLVEGGAEVLLTGRTPENLAVAAVELGSCAHVVSLDPTGPTAVEELTSTVEDRLGPIDFLFVNGGTGLPVPALLPLLRDGGSIVFTRVDAGVRDHGTAEEVARAALFVAVDATFTTAAEMPADGSPARTSSAPQHSTSSPLPTRPGKAGNDDA